MDAQAKLYRSWDQGIGWDEMAPSRIIESLIGLSALVEAIPGIVQGKTKTPPRYQASSFDFGPSSYQMVDRVIRVTDYTE